MSPLSPAPRISRSNALARDPDALVAQLRVHPRRAVGATAGPVDRLKPRDQLGIPARIAVLMLRHRG